MRRLVTMLKYALPALAALLAAGAASFLILDRLHPFPLERVRDRLAASPTLIRAGDGGLLAWRVDREENRRLGLKLKDVSPWLVQATLAAEDKRFPNHLGIDPVATARAVAQNIGSFRRVSGASTITMQTIRLLWQRPRTMTTKIIEAFRAVQLERAVDKDRILEIYFNLAPYGGNVVGAEAAARRYFGKSAAQLNLAEACLLAGLPQSPSRLNPLRNPAAALERRNFVISRMLQDGRIDAEQAERALREPLDIAPGEPVVDALHFAEYVMARTPSGGGSVRTTLLSGLQAKTAALARRHAETLSGKGVAGPAVVVLSLADSSILAYVGNAAPAGASGRLVDGVRAMRQPGSLLKPFIFALLAGEGRLAPSTRVYDLPEAWRGFSPRNMDREWRGELSAADALRESRNVTAVKQLQDLGPGRFADFMGSIGLDAGRADLQGLALALGVKEQNLLSLVNAYAALGRLGQWLPERHASDAGAGEARTVLSPEAAWLTLSALSLPEEAESPRRVWKTGTSWNQLDAWAVAMTPEIAVGVWCGRLGRGGSAWVSGADDALPLALDILEAAGTDRRASWPPPAGVEFVRVCRESGEAPGWHCPDTVRSPVLAAVGLQRCRRHTETAVAAVAPALTPKARTVKLLSPLPGTAYVIPNQGAAALPLLADAVPGRELHWFMDGESLGVGAAGQPRDWVMTPGSHVVSVSDGEGGTARVTFRVEKQ